MPTSDFAKPWFIQGGIPPIVMIWYFFMVLSQWNSRLGFINPGLTLSPKLTVKLTLGVTMIIYDYTHILYEV